MKPRGKGARLLAILDRTEFILPADVAGLRGWERDLVLASARRSASFHEAGHVVAMCLLDVPFDRVSAVADLAAFGRVRHASRAPDSEDHVIALFAGMEAERRFCGNPESVDRRLQLERDFVQAKEMVVRLLGSASTRRVNSKLERMQRQSRRLVNTPAVSQAVQVVAAKLAGGRTLSRKTVCRLVLLETNSTTAPP